MPADEVTFKEFQQLELVVAEIKEALPHPNADKLVIMKIDAGGTEKQIVAGIKEHYGLDELVGKKIVVVNNLAPAVLRGEKSEGMLLAATSDGGGVVLISPEKDCAAGAKIS